jgi:hypothetical protein
VRADWAIPPCGAVRGSRSPTASSACSIRPTESRSRSTMGRTEWNTRRPTELNAGVRDVLPRWRTGRTGSAAREEIAAAGHEIAVHGYRHALVLRRTVGSSTTSIERTRRSRTRRYHARLYRPPCGSSAPAP